MTRRANASGETARLHSSDVRYEAAPVEEDAVLSKFARAAWYCEDAFGYKFDRTLDKKTKKQRDLYVKRENLRYPEHLVCVALLALVSFVEIPLWCLGNRAGLWTWQGHHEVCTAPGHIYLSGIDYWPVGITLLIEVVCVAYLAMLVWLELRSGTAAGVRFHLRLWSTTLLAADVIIFAACLSVGVTPLFRLAPYLRMLLIVTEVDEVFSAAEAVVYVMPNFLLVLSLLALSVCIRVEIKFQAPHAGDATLSPELHLLDSVGFPQRSASSAGSPRSPLMITIWTTGPARRSTSSSTGSVSVYIRRG